MSLHDDEPTLSEEDGVRYLHFGTEWVQGAMQIDSPNKLILDYTRQMMAWLLFVQPQAHDRVVMLGLGAASLLRYTLKHTPAQVHTIERNPQVTAICRAYFRLPASERSTIIHDDAERWVRDPANARLSSALLVDLYDAQAEGPVCDSIEFYQGCRRVLTDTGVAVINLFGRHASYQHNIDNIYAAFDGRVLHLPQTPAGNTVVLAFNAGAMQHTTAQLLERAHAVSAQFKLPAVRWVRYLLDQPCQASTA